jgi:hypothetical protein
MVCDTEPHISYAACGGGGACLTVPVYYLCAWYLVIDLVLVVY